MNVAIVRHDLEGSCFSVYSGLFLLQQKKRLKKKDSEHGPRLAPHLMCCLQAWKLLTLEVKVTQLTSPA